MVVRKYQSSDFFAQCVVYSMTTALFLSDRCCLETVLSSNLFLTFMSPACQSSHTSTFPLTPRVKLSKILLSSVSPSISIIHPLSSDLIGIFPYYNNLVMDPV
jgi:hypothetical protein